MSSHVRPTIEQMERDADYLRKLRGYSSKANKTIEDLPNDCAYSFWKSTGIKPTTKDTSPFMCIMDIVEQALKSPEGKRTLGFDLLNTVIKGLCLPKVTPRPRTPKTKISA